MKMTKGATKKISVIICTYNNADSLDITLSQLKKQNCNLIHAFEVIIVNNNSTDHTQSVIARYCQESHVFVNVFELMQGLSHARNTGLKKAKGEYVLFTDDDADIPENWVEEYLKIIDILNPDCCYSKINVIWDRPKPLWYCEKYGPFFVALDYGSIIKQIDDVDHEFYGKNFCIRKCELLVIGGFDPALGRCGNKMVAGEETVIYRNLIANRKNVIYFPNAGVGHRLKHKEYTEEHITKLFVDGAYSTYYIAKQFAIKKIFNRPLGLIVQSIKIIMSSLFSVVYCVLVRKKELTFYYILQLKRNLLIMKLWFQRP